MYRLGCHCFVALYIATDSFRVRVRARINNTTLRTNRGIIKYTVRYDGTFKKKPQNETSGKPAIVTRERG